MNLGTAAENESDSPAEDRVRDSVPSFLPAGDKRGRVEAEVSDWSRQEGRRRVSVSACVSSVRVLLDMWMEECDKSPPVLVPMVHNRSFAFDHLYRFAIKPPIPDVNTERNRTHNLPISGMDTATSSLSSTRAENVLIEDKISSQQQ